MNWLDLIILLLLAGSFLSGFRMGLIYKVGTVVGFGIGLWLASRVVSQLLEQGSGATSVVSIFFLVLSLVRLACGWVAYFIQKVFNIIAIIPGLKMVNRLFGAILSVLLSVVTIAVVLYILRMMSLNNSSVVADMIDASLLGKIFVNIAGLLPFVLSDHLRSLLENPIISK